MGEGLKLVGKYKQREKARGRGCERIDGLAQTCNKLGNPNPKEHGTEAKQAMTRHGLELSCQECPLITSGVLNPPPPSSPSPSLSSHARTPSASKTSADCSDLAKSED
jgi:hypothetical protein